jgi:hypothetical protein
MALNPQKRPVALAPIRSRPERTYEPIRDQQAPEGRHVPVVLARIHATDSDAWVKLKSQLEEFGRGSGLFSEVGVRQLGRSKRGPFQLEMSIEGQIGKRNLVDIGYGVSQALPIVVDAATATRGRTILIQQPEVHLHPRAQAELGTLFAGLVKHANASLIVETHSDHLVDRVRLAIREGELKPSDVSLLFFERGDGGVRIHPLSLGEDGQLSEVPSSYRSFFLREELRLLGASS